MTNQTQQHERRTPMTVSAAASMIRQPDQIDLKALKTRQQGA
jgi:hypothetical protein